MARWAQIEPVLDELLELRPEQRLDALRARGLDDALESDIEQLLDVDGEEDDLTDGVLRDVHSLARELVLTEDRSSECLVDEQALPSGASVGRYRIVRLIGRGGMGEVYLAERADGAFEQTVALKLMRVTKAESSRGAFLAERQLLATLKHPGIAHLLDGGIADNGRLFFVMEWVEGRPLTDRGPDLCIEERVEIFVRVCEAVAYAHRNLVVHRDIKPSNVLVTEAGGVKLLDFGIAKSLEAGVDGDGSWKTRRHLTPQYAAPEQIAGGAITTATDVYGLGLLLFELLTGERPYTASTDVSGLQEILAEPFPLPSSAANDPGLRKRLRGDLDSIVAKALSENPKDRYSNAEALQEDLECYLKGLPIRGVESSALNILWKWLWRHRTVAASLAVGVAALVAGVTGVVWQSEVAQLERDRALDAEGQARAVQRFLVDDLLALAAPNAGLGAELSMRELLRQAEARLDERLDGEPLVEANVREALATGYIGLGEHERAAHHLDIAVDLLAAVPPNDPQRLQAEARQAENLFRGGSATAAWRLLEQLQPRFSASFGAADLATLRLETLRAEIRVAQGHRLEAERDLKDVLSELDQQHPEALHDRLLASQVLINALQEQRKSSEAEVLCRETLALQRQVLGPEHPQVAATLDLLSGALSRQTRYQEARAVAVEAFELRQRVLGGDHPDTTLALRRIGDAYFRLGLPEEAEATYREVVATQRAVLGDAHPELGLSVNNLGVVLGRKERNEEAAVQYQSALEIFTELHGETHPSTLRAMRNLQSVMERLGRSEESRAMAERILGVGHRLLESDSDDPVMLADLSRDFLRLEPAELQQPHVALQLVARALELTERQHVEALTAAARVYDRLGDVDGAIEALLEAAERPDAVYLYAIERELNRLLLEKGEHERLRRFHEAHLERRRASRSAEDHLIGTSLWWLGLLDIETGEPEQAEARFRAAVAQFRRRLEADDYRVSMARADLADALRMQGRYEEAEEEALAADSALRTGFAVPGSRRGYAEARLSRLYEEWRPPEAARESGGR